MNKINWNTTEEETPEVGKSYLMEEYAPAK
jgi:hypothetical protein